jgi:hypothetical protein
MTWTTIAVVEDSPFDPLSCRDLALNLVVWSKEQEIAVLADCYVARLDAGIVHIG